MLMYEKGSVRAGPRSQKQERMKKIMKKFLSSLLALTMILSLVIVPANATDNGAYTVTGSLSISPSTTTVVSGTNSTTLTASQNFTVVKNATSNPVTEATTLENPTILYSWSGTGVTDSKTSTLTLTNLTTTSASETKTYTCTVTIKDGDTLVATREATATITVTNGQKAFEDATNKTVTYQGRTYTVPAGANPSVTIDTFDDEAIDNLTAKVGGTDTTITKTAANTFTLKSVDNAYSVTLTTTPSKVTGQTLTIDKGASVTLYEGQQIELTATYSRANGNKNVSYAWTSNPDATFRNDTSAKAIFKAPTSVSSDTNYTVTCTVKEGDTTAKTANITITVKDDPYSPNRNGESSSKTIATNGLTNYCTFSAPILYSSTASTHSISYGTSGFDIAWAVERGSALVKTEKQSNGSCKVTALTAARSGSATITATITYMGKQYPALEYTIDISALDAELSSIVNGDSDSYSLTNIKDKLADAIKKQDSSFRYNDINTITVVGTPSRVTLKDGKTTLSNGSSVTDGFTIYADEAYIGDASFQLKVNNNYVVTMYLTVDSKGEIKDTVTGTSAGKSVTFTNSDYDYLYIYEGSSFKTEKYDGDWSKTSTAPKGWKPVAQNKDYTVSSSAFDRNGKATLYVVAVDDDIASTGTITVSQKSYDINYNVVAGKSVTFNQKDFESFLEDYAEDNGQYNSRKDEISFDHAVLTSSIPSAKSEGTLYYGSTEITSSNKSKTDMTDMDKVSFDSVSKPSKDTVTLTFRVYGEIEKPNSRKPDKVNYDVNVVISVVKEDITYTVGIDDTVQMTARDFVNFLQDAKTSYRKAELDYVKFDVSGKNVSSYAYGGLYRSYSSYSTGKLADSTDKFYYEPSRTQYDLADVAYHTTRWAEAGKTVYIPFTVYGTKNEEASGTMAITIAQTMNFIDVKASDFFYEPVKWAVNNKITNGTSSTTFSPYKNCNRAEIVTFLWRAAGTPEPTSTRNPFTDVNSVRDASYYKAILWASQKGITAGTNATTFSPYQECTRSQIVTFLYRYAGKPSGYYSNPFKDVSSVNEASYYNAILWAVGKGITQGTSTTTFSPYASCTRGEAVTFLYRYVNGVK
jgi:hypothetical protein